jgi:hypothetical protein
MMVSHQSQPTFFGGFESQMNATPMAICVT